MRQATLPSQTGPRSRSCALEPCFRGRSLARSSRVQAASFRPVPAPPFSRVRTPTPAQPSPQPQPKPTPEPEKVEPQDIPTSEPQKNYGPEVLNNLKSKVKDIDGQKVVNKQDYETAVKDLYNRKEGDWKNYQRQVAGNDRAGEGTRARFDKESRTELDTLLNKDNIKVQDENQPENLSETIKRIKTLINSLV